MIIPAKVIDIFGNRIGSGKGYYDKYLSNTSPKLLKICICYEA